MGGRDIYTPLVERRLSDLDPATCAPSATTLETAPNPSAWGQVVTFTATVSASAGTPVGQVQFQDGGGLPFGSPAPLSEGHATLTWSSLSPGDHTITARYLGGPGLLGSTSPPVIQTVIPGLTIDDPTVNAADGAAMLIFTVTLNGPRNVTVAVDYSTADHTARAGVDYSATSGTLTFSPGETQKSLPVPIVGWKVPQSSKDFFVVLSNPDNAVLAKSAAIGTITWYAPGSLTLAIGDPSVHEGHDSLTLLGFPVQLSRPSAGFVTVSYATADATAKAGTDYTATSGVITFSPGQTTRSVLVPVLGNTAVESDRTLFVNLTNATTTETTGITIAKTQGVGTIVDDDPPSAPATVAQYRLYSPMTYEHLYTTDTNEYAVLGTVGWLQEGSAYTIFKDGGPYGGVSGVPLYRLYHAGVRQHHWTTDWYEVTVLSAGAWTYEGIPGYVLPTAVTGTVPLYRLALAYPPLHLWTTDQNEYQVLTTPQRGWIGEGVIGYVLP